MTNTTLNSAISAAKSPLLLENAAHLPLAEEIWSKAAVLGIDTEFVRERTYRADLGLVQVSDGQHAWLLDPLLPEAREPIKGLMENTRILKILHSGTEDLEVLFHSVGAIPRPLFDSQMACAMLGQSLQLGYHHAVDWLFGLHVDKDQTRTNWMRRPLSEKQLHYAAMDVVLLPEMHSILADRLEQAGRTQWMEEDVARIQEQATVSPEPARAYLRFNAAGKLDEASLRALRALAAWREETAIARNRARGFVISDAGLLNLAKQRPANPQALAEIEDIHPRALQRFQTELLAVIAEAAEDDSAVYTPAPLDNSQRALLKELRAQVRETAESLSIDPALLASRRQIEELIRSAADGQAVPSRFNGWRKEVLGDAFFNGI